MSRQWKSLPTHLPGWHLADRSSGMSRRARKRFKKRRKFLSRISKPTYSFPRPSGPRPSPKPKPSKPITLFLRVEMPSGPAFSAWRRTAGRWRCTNADPAVEWFLRVLHVQCVEDWVRLHHFSYKWLKTIPGITANPMPEAVPAEAYPPLQASAPQGDNTGTPSPIAPRCGAVPAGLERTGLIMPCRLIVEGSPLNTEVVSRCP